MYAHQEADRVPIMEKVWDGTIRRWEREGMPAGMDWRDYFDVDKVAHVRIDISPQYPIRVLEEDERSITRTTEWGATIRTFKEIDSTQAFLDFKVTTPEAWEECKARMLSRTDLVDWKFLEQNFPVWQEQGQWICAHFWFGFDLVFGFCVI